MPEPDQVEAAVDAAAEELYGAPLSAFTAERKRRAEELRARGERKAAAAVAKLARPQMSAWVVNRLYREARDDLDALLAAGARVRGGDHTAIEAQRAALARLRGRAAQVLVTDEHVASPATLQRVATTLQALSASGSFEPDRPGRLIDDRDPPGFEVVAATAMPPVRPRLTLVPPPAPEPATAPTAPTAAERAQRERDERDAREERERAERAEQERRARARAAERVRLERVAAAAAQAVQQRTTEVAALRNNLDAARAALETLRERIQTAEAALTDAQTRASRAAAALHEA